MYSECCNCDIYIYISDIVKIFDSRSTPLFQIHSKYPKTRSKRSNKNVQKISILNMEGQELILCNAIVYGKIILILTYRICFFIILLISMENS